MRRTFLCLAALCAWLAAAGASAQVLPQKPGVDKLANGLTVVTIPWRSPGMAAYFTLVRAGSRDETDKGHTGFAHLFEHLMFRGTKRFPSAVYEAKMQELGADNNAFTWFDLTVYSVVAPSEGLPQIIEIEADRFRNLDFLESDFKTETGAVLGEYNMGSAHPELKMDEKLLSTAFTRHTYGHDTIGWLEDIKAMPGYFKYSKRFEKRFYAPDDMFVVVAGDFDRADVLKRIEAAYGDWKLKRAKTRVKLEPEQNEPRSAHVPWTGPTSPKMIMAYKIPAFKTNADSAALEIVSHLAFGESSPLFRKLVVEDQKVLSLEASNGIFAPLSRDPFLFQVQATLKEGTTFAEVQAAVDAAIAEVAEGKVPKERIEAVKSNARYGFLLSLETPKDAALTMVALLSATGDPSAVDGFGKALEQVTPEDVVRVAKTFLTEKRRTVVTMATAQGGAK
ncbi:MAG: pitrilysin family protein [Deltaproteobacteria bacterium]|nr:pitrilysin family protein [Deltaproteobacteria bacterium]